MIIKLKLFESISKYLSNIIHINHIMEYSDLRDQLEDKHGKIDEIIEYTDSKEINKENKNSKTYIGDNFSINFDYINSKYVEDIDGNKIYRYNVISDNFEFLYFVYDIFFEGKKFIAIQREVDRSNTSLDIIGTSHYSSENKDIISNKFDNHNYDKCLIELDKPRYMKIKDSNKKDSVLSLLFVKPFKNKNFIKGFILFPLLLILSLIITIFKSLAKIHKFYISDIRNREFASDFKTAIKYSEDTDTPLYLIDRPINQLIKSYLNETNLKGLIKLIYILIITKLKVTFGRNKKADNVKQSIDQLVDEHPILHKYLVEQRDNYMYSNILDNVDDNENIIIVVGLGHVDGIVDKLDNHNFKEINITTVDNMF